MADPHRPGACEVANIQEVSRSMGKQILIARLRGIRRPKDFAQPQVQLPHLRLVASSRQITLRLCDTSVLGRIGARPDQRYHLGWRLCMN